MIRLGICNELFEGRDLAGTCRLVKSLGYDGLEIAPFTLAPRITDVTGRRREIRAIIEDAGLATIGLHWLLAKTDGFYLTSARRAEVRRRTGDYLPALARGDPRPRRELDGPRVSPKQRNLLPGVAPWRRTGTRPTSSSGSCPTRKTAERRPLPRTARPVRDRLPQHLRPGPGPDRPGRAPERLKLHMDVKAQSAEVGATVPELIARHAAQAGHFHAQDVNLRGARGWATGRLRADPAGAGRLGLRSLGLGRGLRLLAGGRGDGPPESLSLR